MREIRSPGSVRGAARKGRPYRDRGLKRGGFPHAWGDREDDSRWQSRRTQKRRAKAAKVALGAGVHPLAKAQL